MSDIIRLLPDALANQIAAGEVVQRPASVLKELLENAIDAGSKYIQVVLRDAGKSLIQVTDDGTGMSETDARLSFERHATSKIRETEDLFRIRTMGFRGEALASIAAVAQVEMKTRRREDELGTFLAVEGSEVKKQEPAQTNQGTTICVKNLFYNVPARRNFLKSNPVEMRHLNDEFQRVALANPEVSLSLTHNDLEIYQLTPGKLSQRIVGLFGKGHREQLVAVDEDTNHMVVHGYIGKPEFSRRTRGEQFFFVNNRYIRNNYLNHAVVNAFEGLMREDHYPFYVLFIEIDPSHIDINVHPTKTEIKFDDERTVYGIIRSAVKQGLGTHNIAPSLDFDQDVNFSAFGSGGPEHSGGFDSGQNPSFRSAPKEVSMPRYPDKRGFDREWQKLYEGLESDPTPEQELSGEGQSLSLTLESAANRLTQTSGQQD
ncbi:MAG: DNA mismatch repair endonuclease MutL, partial [Cyclobacteriaceae bacterium]